MTVEEMLVAALSGQPGLAGVSAYPEVAPESAVAPYIVYVQYAGSRVSDLRGDAGLANPLFQIDVYAPRKQQAVGLNTEIRKAILASTMKATLKNERSDYEPDTRLYRHSQDFSFWIND